MAAGNAFLGLAGPVGWTIGGVAIAGSAIYLQQQNAKFAKEATEQRLSVEAELRSLKTAGREIRGLSFQTRQVSDACLSDLEWLTEEAPRDYLSFSTLRRSGYNASQPHSCRRVDQPGCTVKAFTKRFSWPSRSRAVAATWSSLDAASRSNTQLGIVLQDRAWMLSGKCRGFAFCWAAGSHPGKSGHETRRDC